MFVLAAGKWAKSLIIKKAEQNEKKELIKLEEINAIRVLVNKQLITKEEGYDLIVKLFSEELTEQTIPEVKVKIKDLDKTKKRKYNKSKKSKSDFSEKEDKYIEDHFKDDKIVNIAKAIKRDVQQVYARARKLGLRKWKKKTESKEQESSQEESAKVLTEKLNKKELVKWSATEDATIVENYGVVSVGDIAKQLNREESEVRKRIADLEKIGEIK